MNEEVDLEEYAPWLMAAITIAGICFRSLLLPQKGMSVDETLNLWLASHSVREMLQWLPRINQQPPLYYLLLHGWTAMEGNSANSARFLSVLFGAGAIPFIYLTGKRLADTTVGLAAVIILAFSPIHIFFAQDTSMYTLLMFNAAAAIYALSRLLTDPRTSEPIGRQFREFLRAWRRPAETSVESRGDIYSLPATTSKWAAWVSRHQGLPLQSIETDLAWLAFILFSAATLLSHNSAVLFLLTVDLFVFGLMIVQKTRHAGTPKSLHAPAFWNWAAANVCIFILVIPWAIPYLQQPLSAVKSLTTTAPTWGTVLATIESFIDSSSLIPANIATGIWTIYGLIFIAGILYFRKRIPQLIFLTSVFVLPILAELTLSLWHPYFSSASLLWTTIPLFLVLAAGIKQFKFPSFMILGLGILVTLNIFSASDYFKFYQKEDWNSAARDVAGYAENGDLILFNSNLGEIPFEYYFKPYEEDYSLQVKKLGIPLDLEKSGAVGPEMTANDAAGLASLASRYERIWLVSSNTSSTDPQSLIPQTLASGMKIAKDEGFYGGEVRLYVKP